MPLLEIQDLVVEFESPAGCFRVVDGVSLSLEAGETLCLVGESGSGKSVTALSIARLVPAPPAVYPSGTIHLAGRAVFDLDPAGLRQIRGGVVSYVFQEPGASLNPAMPVGRQILEMLQLHRPSDATRAEVVRLLNLVGIAVPEQRYGDYPHQLSGGMQQRCMIAMALAARPALLVADEPTTALDVTIQAQIMDLFRALKKQFGMATLLITHNLAIVAEMADRVAVMYAGQVVEEASAEALLRQPRHPYTRALLAALPGQGASGERLLAIPGTVPTPDAWPAGCRFHPRCPQARPECARQAAVLAAVAPGHWARCPYAAVEACP